MTATVSGDAEYWSEVPYADKPTPNGTNFLSNMDFDDLWEFMAGAGISIALNGPAN